MTTSQQAQLPAVTRREAHALNEARRALQAIESRAAHRAWHSDEPQCEGRLAGTASCAADAVFSVLSIAHVYVDSPQAKAAIDRYYPVL